MKRHFGITRDALLVFFMGIVLTALALTGSQELWRIYFAGIITGGGIVMAAVDWYERPR